MSRWLYITFASLLLLIMTAACGEAVPSADSGIAASCEWNSKHANQHRDA